MLSRFVKLEIVVGKFLSYLRSDACQKDVERVKHTSPTPVQWFSIKYLVLLLDPFDAATKMLSGSRYPTLAFAFPVLRHIKRQLQREGLFEIEVISRSHDYVEFTLDFMQRVRLAVLGMSLKRFSSQNIDLMWISFLEPRPSDMDH